MAESERSRAMGSWGAGIALLCLVVASGGEAQAFTSIVAVWTPREVFIGADSKATISRGQAATGAPSCKIQQTGGFMFATAGRTVGLRQSGVAFDIFGLARQAAEAEGGLEEQAARFAELVSSALTAEVEAVRTQAPESYGETLRGRVLAASLLAGVEDGAPVLVVVEFIVREDATGAARVAPRLKVYGSNREDVAGMGTHAAVFLGSREEIQRRVAANPNWWRPNVVEGIRGLIKAEIEHNPQYVGLPIDLVVIDRGGARWMERKAQCPAIGPPLAH